MNEDPYLNVYGCAKTAMRRYPTVPLLDYVRAGHEWVAGHPLRWAKALEDNNFQAFNRRVLGHLEAWGLSETARRNGFRAEDVYFYGLDVIANVLPGLWDENYSGLPAEFEEVRQKRDAAEGNNWPVLLADVTRAYASSPDWAKEALFCQYGIGVAQSHEDTEAALIKLRDLLGGARPQGCSRACEECGDDA